MWHVTHRTTYTSQLHSTPHRILQHHNKSGVLSWQRNACCDMLQQIVMTSFDMTKVCLSQQLCRDKSCHKNVFLRQKCACCDLSWQKFCNRSMHVATQDLFKYAYCDNFCHDKIVFAKTDCHNKKIVAQLTELCLSWRSFVVTKMFCHEPNKLKTFCNNSFNLITHIPQHTTTW